MNALEWGVVGAGLWALGALLAQRRWVKGFGRRTLFSVQAGDPRQGVRYAFTAGMAPRAKESVQEHLPSYVAGLAFHGGLLGALGLLAAALGGLVLPPWLLHVAQILVALGLAGGLGLLAKRVLKAELRGLSVPDDFLSNLFCTTFLGLSLGVTVAPDLATAWRASAIALLVYAPLGKIRHCLFFFSTRYHFGAFFGRRGVFPPVAQG